MNVKENTLIFSAPGRTELSGNHTDHQRGCVLAAAVDLEITAQVSCNDSNEIRIFSQGYAPFSVSLSSLGMQENERNTSAALVRGMAKAFTQRGAVLQGFDARVQSSVLPGSGLSSSAAFEVLLGTIMNELFFDSRCTPVEIAQMGQWAENHYFGKPCGLMDQMASSVGGMVFIDFYCPDQPYVESIPFDFASSGYCLCIIDSGADHADLTDEYAAIPREMSAVAGYFGKTVLREVEEELFYRHLPQLRKEYGDRAVLRCIHFFDENRRVRLQALALKKNDFHAFLHLTNESGQSSWQLLQNITPCGAAAHQELALTLTVARKQLAGRGAVRVHGGGFAGTIQAFVPQDQLEDFRSTMEALLGQGCCHVLSIRPQGGMQIS